MRDVHVNTANGTAVPRPEAWPGGSDRSIALIRHEPGDVHTALPRYTANLGSDDFRLSRSIHEASALTLVTNPHDREWRRRSVPVAAGPTGRFLFVGHEATSKRQGLPAQLTRRAARSPRSGQRWPTRWRQRGRPDSRSLRQVRLPERRLELRSSREPNYFVLCH